MILGFEHVHDVGPKGLRRFDDIGTFRILFTGNFKILLGPVHRDAALDQGVDELASR
jgi:hypothetical protein